VLEAHQYHRTGDDERGSLVEWRGLLRRGRRACRYQEVPVQGVALLLLVPHERVSAHPGSWPLVRRLDQQWHMSDQGAHIFSAAKLAAVPLNVTKRAAVHPAKLAAIHTAVYPAKLAAVHPAKLAAVHERAAVKLIAKYRLPSLE